MAVDVLLYNNQEGVMDAVISLERRNFSKTDSWAGVMPRELKRRNTSMHYASIAGKVVGYILCTSTQFKVHISKIAVDKAHRRQGIATQMFQVCLDLVIKLRGVICATLHVDPANTAARSMYLRLGFKCDATLQDYYAPSRHCWKMLKDL